MQTCMASWTRRRPTQHVESIAPDSKGTILLRTLLSASLVSRPTECLFPSSLHQCVATQKFSRNDGDISLRNEGYDASRNGYLIDLFNELGELAVF